MILRAKTLFHKATKASSESLDLEHGELWVRMQRFEATIFRWVFGRRVSVVQGQVVLGYGTDC